MSRIGILSGSFDPVHVGHIAFGLQAMEAAKLDRVYFAPEATPRRKEGVVHIAHRLAMLRLATQSHPGLEVLQLPDKNFSVIKTIPRLLRLFPDDKLYYLCGSDMLRHMPEWSYIDQLFAHMGLIVATRGADSKEAVESLLKLLPAGVKNDVIIVDPGRSTASAGKIRAAIAAQLPPEGLLPSTHEYIARNWLYSVPGTPVSS